MACPSQTQADKVLSFSLEATAELSQQQDLLSKIKAEITHRYRKTLLPLTLMLATSLVIVYHPKALFIWFIVGLFLYSYNFVILLMPTTSVSARPKKQRSPERDGTDRKLLAVKRLLRKKKLAVEMGLTLFLGRMVPLTASFTVILGLGMSILVYFLFTGYTAATGLVWLIIIQVLLILIFYALLNFLRPQSQGITSLARSWKRRLGAAQSRGRISRFFVRSAAVGVVVTSIALFIGALITPGVTLITLLTSLGDFTAFDLLIFVGLFIVQLWAMRSLQSLMSQRMAIDLLHVRIDVLQQLLGSAETLGENGGSELDEFESLDSLLYKYYSIMVYDIFRLDFFGLAPVYLVGPRLKYVLDEKVLERMPD
jgi:hypothetical protein